MNKSSGIFLTFLALSLVVLPAVSYAEDTATEASPTMKAREQRTFRQEIQITKTQMREDLKEKIRMRREENQEKIKTEREEFKTKIAELKDARKKTIMQNLDTKISNWNKLRTDQFVMVLEKLTLIVDRVEEKTTKMKAEGKNTSGVETAIASARTAISTATTAVEAQAAKSYVISVTDETTLKENSKTTVQSLQNDIKSTAATVKAARDAVQAIFQEIAKVIGRSEKVSPTAAI